MNKECVYWALLSIYVQGGEQSSQVHRWVKIVVPEAEGQQVDFGIQTMELEAGYRKEDGIKVRQESEGTMILLPDWKGPQRTRQVADQVADYLVDSLNRRWATERDEKPPRNARNELKAFMGQPAWEVPLYAWLGPFIEQALGEFVTLKGVRLARKVDVTLRPVVGKVKETYTLDVLASVKAEEKTAQAALQPVPEDLDTTG
ncbi:MAG: hypothetical protein GC129_04205 [Proteobacteria bacterium]|nr:hypothetical protein [Pseudomonadota bacterium]